MLKEKAVTEPDVPTAPTGVEVWMGPPTNVTLKDSGSWVGRGCSVESGTGDKVGQKGEEEGKGEVGPGTGLAGSPSPLHPPLTFAGGSRPCSAS